ncbi:hypothetical protein ACQJBY_023660 [Aegilops geniculata]
MAGISSSHSPIDFRLSSSRYAIKRPRTKLSLHHRSRACRAPTIRLYILSFSSAASASAMANHGAAALLIACLLVAAVTLADARVTAMQLQRGSINGVYALTKAVPALTCNKVSAVQTGETCSSLAESAGLSQEDFLGFNPNINCVRIFVGQWVCLDASSA